MPVKNDEIIIDITDYSTDGYGIGKYDGMAIFVPLTAVGDRVKVKLLKVKKTYAYGKLSEIIVSSPDRTENDCPVFRQCGGCAFRHISYEAEKQHKYSKVYETVKRIGGVDILPEKILWHSPERYRNKAQFPVCHDKSTGFFAFHSHRIIPVSDCLLQPEVFSNLTCVTEKWAKKYDIPVYNEATNKGLLRHIYIRKAMKTGELMFVAVINGESLPHYAELISALLEAAGNSLKSVQININKKDTNVILGDRCVTLYGEDHITDELCGVKVRLSALSFYQVNRAMAEKLYYKASEYAEPEGKTVLDLYCGAGTIGLSMAKCAKSIIGVEIVPEAVRDAKENAKQNGIENARFICSDAAEAAVTLAKEGITPDVVIVDPPRKGCSEALIDTVTKQFSPERVVYVSCDPATLARDIKLFSECGYKLSKYTPADLFPRTSHVETVALLVKKDQSLFAGY